VPKFGDRVKETTDTTGTGTVDLSGAPTGFRSFSDEFTSGDNDISYLIVDDPENPSEYEYGKGTYTAGTPDTFARDTVEGSSNNGNKVSFVAGTKTIIATPTSTDFNVFGGDGPWAAKTALTKSITGNTTQIASDDGKLILADGSGNSPTGLTYTLLAAATAGDGFVVSIINIGASGSVTVDGSGSETINGETTFTLSLQYQAIRVRCDGTQWFVDAIQPSAGAEGQVWASDGTNGVWESRAKAETVVATTSGSSHTFTIPTWAKWIMVTFAGVSTNGTANYLLRLGDAGGIESTGYLSAASVLGGSSVSTSQPTTAFLLMQSVAAGTSMHGLVLLALIDPATNKWTCSGNTSKSDATASHVTSGSKALSGALTQIELSSGDTFDAGQINVVYG